MYYNSPNTQYHSRTPHTEMFNLNKENYYEDQQNDPSPLVVMTLIELGPHIKADTHNASPTFPYMWWHDLGLDNEKYEEWEKDDPDRVKEWETEWMLMHEDATPASSSVNITMVPNHHKAQHSRTIRRSQRTCTAHLAPRSPQAMMSLMWTHMP
ncbi:hypothetical protein K439DRAFT_1610923 [Ramaria rubella]|nr:hypothetical protein K439DRAFT_1610923 [Ramaria rubella]